MKEIWKPVKGFKNYEVSNTGKVRSLPRVRMCVRGGTEFPMILKGKELSTEKEENSYVLVSLVKRDGRIFKERVHRIVAKAFIPKPKGCDTVLHIDDNKSNNRVTNLKWGTQLENLEDMRNKDRQVKGVSVPNAVLNDKLVRTILKRHYAGASTQALADEYGVAFSTIRNIERNIAWKHVSRSIK